MSNKKVLSFKETMVESDYLKTLTKEQKKEYKRKSVNEKRKIIHEFNPDKFQPSNNKGNKFINWIKKHKILSGFIALFLVIGTISAAIEDNEDESEKPKKETASKKESKNDKNNSKHKKESKENKNPKKSLSPEQKLAKDIKNTVGKEHYHSIDFHDGNLVVNLKNFDGFSRKGMIKSANRNTVAALEKVKKSKIEPQSVAVNVMQDVTTSDLKDTQANFIRSEWDIQTINRLDSSNAGIVMEDPGKYADSYRVNPNIE